MNAIFTILPDPGKVLVVTLRCRGVEFVWGYCRTAHFMHDRIICLELIRQSGDSHTTFKIGPLDPAVNGLDIAALQPWMDSELL